MIIFAIVWHVFLMLFVFVDQLPLGMLLIGLSGLAHSLSLVPLVGLLMRTSEPTFSGACYGCQDARHLYTSGKPHGRGLAD